MTLDDSDSDFYGTFSNTLVPLYCPQLLTHTGDEETVAKLQARVDSFDASQACRDIQASAQVKAKEKKKAKPSPKPAKLHNPYENVPYAWQLNETLPAFFQRLPPQTTEATETCPWIFICNPYIPRQSKQSAQNQQSRGNEDEAPEEEGTQLGRFIEGGTERLHLLTDFKEGIKKSGKAPSVVIRTINQQKKQAVDDILMLATACKVKAGKVSGTAHFSRATPLTML